MVFSLSALISFLIVVLIVIVVLWGFNLILARLSFPPDVKQIILVIVSIVALILLLIATMQIFGMPVRIT